MKSKDESTHVGAVIVGPDHEIRSTGYNSFPRGLQDNVPGRQERPLKYSLMEHAERNCIYNAARVGVSCKDCTLYVTWCPCVECARAIVQTGISNVVVHSENPNNRSIRWRDSIDLSAMILRECEVTLWWWSGAPLVLSGLSGGKRYDLSQPW